MTACATALAWSDDLYLHGHHLSRWVVDYVDIEESLAVGSIAQEDLAHAAALHELAGVDIDGRDWRIYYRPVERWWPSRLLAAPSDDWPTTVARAFLFSVAAGLMVEQLQRSALPAVRDTAAVMAAEQRLHVMHWERWVDIFARDVQTRGRFVSSLRATAASAADLFGPVPGNGGADLAVAFDGEAAHRTWMTEATARLDALGVPRVRLPDRAAPRIPGGDPECLAGVLRDMRAIRVGQPDRVYQIYKIYK